MTRTWVTTASTSVEAMVNPIIAACERGFVPERLNLVDNPGVSEQVTTALDLAAEVVTAYGGAEPDVEVTSLEREVDFEDIHAHVRDAVEATHEDGGAVAVDITPGRKFMSAISFAAGLRYDAEHVFYFYVDSPDYFGRLYPEIPRTATRLYDFTEAL